MNEVRDILIAMGVDTTQSAPPVVCSALVRLLVDVASVIIGGALFIWVFVLPPMAIQARLLHKRSMNQAPKLDEETCAPSGESNGESADDNASQLSQRGGI